MSGVVNLWSNTGAFVAAKARAELRLGGASKRVVYVGVLRRGARIW